MNVEQPTPAFGHPSGEGDLNSAKSPPLEGRRDGGVGFCFCPRSERARRSRSTSHLRSSCHDHKRPIWNKFLVTSISWIFKTGVNKGKRCSLVANRFLVTTRIWRARFHPRQINFWPAWTRPEGERLELAKAGSVATGNPSLQGSRESCDTHRMRPKCGTGFQPVHGQARMPVPPLLFRRADPFPVCHPRIVRLHSRRWLFIRI